MYSLGFKHSEPNDVGRPPYNPADLLKLYAQGYLKHMRSSRVLEEACRINLETIWLMKKLAPDFKTIADFRKDNIDLIKNVFKEFVSFLQDVDLVEGKLASIDGSKIRACNVSKRNFNAPYLASKLKRIEPNVRATKEGGRSRDGSKEIIDQVVDRARKEPEKLGMRIKLAEHPFGTIKRAFSMGYFLLKDLRKVKGEMGFTVLAYDIRRALNKLGTSGLLRALMTTTPTGGTARPIK
ncbi:MAG: transposase [Nitrososphaerales archaeon]